jgi:hypothetical protein
MAKVMWSVVGNNIGVMTVAVLLQLKQDNHNRYNAK